MENNVAKFLIEAKKATYAGYGPEKLPSRPSSHDYEYKDGGLLYIDTYFGGQKFVGEEILFRDEKAFWSMNYAGRVINIGFDGDFLKKALSNVQEDMPFRGPREYKSGDYIYKCFVQGDFDWFEGHEEIFRSNVKVYECRFHGGDVE